MPEWKLALVNGSSGTTAHRGSLGVAVIVGIVLVGAVAIGGVLALGVGDVSPTAQPNGPTGVLAGEHELATADTTFLGEADGDRAGHDVIRAGDINGNGHDDVLVSAPFADHGGEDAGAVYLFYGPIEPGERELGDADAIFVGEAAGDRAGMAIAAGDLNADGHSDVVIGAPRHDVEGASNAGAVYVVDGATEPTGVVPLADADAKLVGESPGNWAGSSLDVAENFTGDGSGHLVIGAPLHDGDATDVGAVYLQAGAALEGLHELADADATFVGEGSGDEAGSAVAVAGDVAGDGAQHLLIGAPYNDSTAEDAGAAYLVAAADHHGPVSLTDVGTKLEGAAEGDRAGWAVSSAGDVNDDGFADVLVGAPYNDSGGEDAGVAYVVFGGEHLGTDAADPIPLAAADVTFVGEGPNDRAGWAVSSAGTGTSTCDGYDDVLVGAPWNDSTAPAAGAAYVIYGDAEPVAIQDLSESDAILVGEGERSLAGFSVTEAFDANDDGRLDLLVGAPFTDSTGEDAGAAYIVHGDCPIDDVEKPDPKEPRPLTPEPTPEPTPDHTPEPTPTPEVTPEPTPTPEVTPDPTPTPEVTPDPTPTPEPTPTETPTPDEPELDRVFPDQEITVAPGTNVWFEVTSDDRDDFWSPAWHVGGELVDFSEGPWHHAYFSHTGNHYFVLTFDEEGTYEVTAYGLAIVEDEDDPAVNWTVHVDEAGNEQPQIETVGADERTVYFGETAELTVAVEDPDGELERIIWWVGMCDYVHDITDVAGAQDTATIEIDVTELWDCPVMPQVMDESGVVSTAEPLWSFEFEDPITTTIADTNEPVERGETLEVTAEIENVGTESHDVEAMLVVGEYDSDTGWEWMEDVDTGSVTVASGERTALDFTYEVGADDDDLAVQVRTEDPNHGDSDVQQVEFVEETPTPKAENEETPTPDDETPTPDDETPTPDDETPTPDDETPTPDDENA